MSQPLTCYIASLEAQGSRGLYERLNGCDFCTHKAKVWSLELAQAGLRLILDAIEPQDMSSWTRSRWLYNEQEQLAARYLPFNIDALKAVAVEACNAETCVSFEKFAEGSFNRVFRLRLDNNDELVARLPFPIGGPKHLATASEVATLDFARTELDIVVPHVRAWCSCAEETPVGAEYIINDMLPGTTLNHRWQDMDATDITNLVADTVVAQYSMIFRFQFSQIGSLYYKEDVEPALRSRPFYAGKTKSTPNSERFAIGPMVDRDLWRRGRHALNIDRGPWQDYKSYFHALINCERAWLNAQPNPPSPEILRLLDATEKLVPHLLPSTPSNILYHPDLTRQNFLVTEAGPVKLTGIIDWQGTCIAPLPLQFLSPPEPFAYHSTHTNPRIIYDPASPSRPEYADTFRSLPDGDLKHMVELAMKEAEMAHAYRTFIDRELPKLEGILSSVTAYRILMGPLLAIRQRPGQGAGELRDELIEVVDFWRHLAKAYLEQAPGVAPPTCPIEFSVEEREQHHEEYHREQLGRRVELYLMAKLGVADLEGMVPPERYDELKQALKELKAHMLEADCEDEQQRSALIEAWPWEDGKFAYSLEKCRD